MSSSDPPPESASSTTAPEQVDEQAQASSQAATTADDSNGDAAAAASSSTTDAHHAAAAAAAPTETPASSSTDDLADAATLRSRIADLTNQVTGLNGKLVSSFMRISDLEDDLSDARERVMSGSTKVAELEKERQEHLAALNTGLLVEKAHVSTEMTRMMDRVIEETKQRGAAESEKAKIEAELDELSASLFNEANRMVAVEKLARHRAEEKSKSMEERLQDTEGIMLEQQKVVADLQKRLDEAQQQQAKKDGDGAAATAAATAQHEMVASSSRQHSSSPPPLILMLDIVPYQELHAFLNHLRKLRKQLAPFYTYPYDPARPYLSHRKTSSGNYPTSNSANASSSSSSLASSSSSSSSSATAHNFTPASSADATQTSPFLLAGVSRHKDYPLLPSNCESLVSLSSQLSLPFIKRCQEEDSDPCLRLDFAPGLNWLSRRQANTAILDGLLVIEPVFPGGKVEDEEGVRRQYRHLPPAACAMCGMHVVNVPMPGGGGHSTGAGGETTTTMASWAQSAALSLRDVAGGSASGSSSLSPSIDSTTSGGGADHASSSPSAGASPKPPTLKTARSGLFSSLSSLRAKAGSPKLPLWADGSGESSAAQAGDATGNNSAATTPGVTCSSAVDPLSSATADDHSSHQGSAQPLPVPTHIFRLSETATSRYLLCPHHCLARLRAACAFWGYLRSLERQVVLEGKLAWGDEVAKVGQERRGSVQGGVNGVIKEEETSQAAAPLSPAGRDKALPPVQDAASTDSAAAAAATPTSRDSPAPTSSTTADEPKDIVVDGESSGETGTDVHTKRSSNGSSDDDEDGTDGGFHDAQSQDGHHNGGGGASEATKKEEDEAPSSPLDEAKAEPQAPGGEDDDEEEANNSGATETSTSTKVPPAPAALDIPKANEGHQHRLGDAEDGRQTPTVSSAAAATAGAAPPMSPSTSMGPPPVPPRRSAAVPSSAGGGGGPPALPARRERNATAPASAPPPPPPRVPRAKRTLHEVAGEEDAGEEGGGKLAGPATTWEEKVWLEVTKLKRDMWQARVGFEERSTPVVAATSGVKAVAPEAEAEAPAAGPGPEVVVTDAKVESNSGGKGDDAAEEAK